MKRADKSLAPSYLSPRERRPYRAIFRVYVYTLAERRGIKCHIRLDRHLADARARARVCMITRKWRQIPSTRGQLIIIDSERIGAEGPPRKRVYI